MAISMNALPIGVGTISLIFSVAAAVFWFKSAEIETPENFFIHIVRPDHDQLLGGNPLGERTLGAPTVKALRISLTLSDAKVD